MKPARGSYQPATQVKVLSPEINDVRKADSFHMLEGGTLYFVKVRDTLLSRGLSPWDDNERIKQELGRSILFPIKGYLPTIPKGEEAEMTVWKSDYPILVKKQSNVCGAKGITLLCKGEEKHSLTGELEALWKRD